MSYNPTQDTPFFRSYVTTFVTDFASGDYNNPVSTNNSLEKKFTFDVIEGCAEMLSDGQTFISHLPNTILGEVKINNWDFRLLELILSTQFRENGVLAGSRGQDAGEQDNSAPDLSDTAKSRTQTMPVLLNEGYSKVTLELYHYINSRSQTASSTRYNLVVLPKETAIFGILT